MTKIIAVIVWYTFSVITSYVLVISEKLEKISVSKWTEKFNPNTLSDLICATHEKAARK